MLGTLVVCLPITFSGGALVASHRGLSVHFDWGPEIEGQADPSRVHWAAFLGDVDHRVEEVHRGHRVTLAYTLRRCASDARPSEQLGRAEVLSRTLGAALAHRWFMTDGGVLAFPCFHLYRHDLRAQPSTTPLVRADLARLKGVDAEVAAAALGAGLHARLTPYVSETCADETWALTRFPTAAESRSLRGRVVPWELAQKLPVCGESEAPEETSARRLTWVLPHARDDDDEDDSGESPGGERVSSGTWFLGACLGHRARVGGRVVLGYGAEVPNDAVLVAPIPAPQELEAAEDLSRLPRKIGKRPGRVRLHLEDQRLPRLDEPVCPEDSSVDVAGPLERGTEQAGDPRCH